MPDASHDFGGHLRQAREQKGVSLRQIADRTKISVPALEALERNDISRLPGGIFTRAFVRAYAREVGLDPEDTVRRFLGRFPDESTDELPPAYEANPSRIEVDEAPTFGRAWRAVAWSVPIVLGVAYFGFGGRLPLWRDRPAPTAPAKSAQTQAAAPASVPSVITPPADGQQAPAPGADSTPAPADAAAQGQAPAPGDPTLATPDAALAAPMQPPVASASAADASAPPTRPAVQPSPSLSPGSYRLTLAPREACWVSVKVDGASVFSQLMRPGERKELTLQGEASLTVGNAAAFDFLLNDQRGRSLGGPGQVVTARLNLENLKTFLESR